jgi:hypothetical protein
MVTPLILVVAGILALGGLIYLLSGVSRYEGGDLDKITSHLRRLDVEAFRNLIDEREEKFLRSSLSGFEFWSTHRKRMLAAVDYVQGAARNAGMLIRLAYAAKHDPDPAVVAAAEKLLESAMQVGLSSLLCKRPGFVFGDGCAREGAAPLPSPIHVEGFCDLTMPAFPGSACAPAKEA